LDDLVKSRISIAFANAAKAGIQLFKDVLDPVLTEVTLQKAFYEIINLDYP